MRPQQGPNDNLDLNETQIDNLNLNKIGKIK